MPNSSPNVDSVYKETEELRISAADRLLGAVDGMWRSHGRAQMSARQVSQSANAQASQINYYFGGFEQLLCSAQGHAIARAGAWCERTLEEMGRCDATANGGEAFGHLLAAVIDDWCRTQADLAFAWGECQILAARQPDFADANAQWRLLWKRFWDEACARMGLEAYADLMRVFFNGEAFLHRIVWRSAFDRACLSETCVSWMRLLLSGDPGAGPLRDYARVETARFAAPVLVAGSAHERIAEAAADIVGRDGAAAVTHRAVAQAAGLNLGAVTYHFPSSGDLMAAAWAYIYLRLTRPHLTNDTAPVTRDSYIDGLTAYSAADARQPDALAMEALMSQAGRDDSLRDRGAMIRYTRGQTTLHRLSRLPRAQGALGPQAAGLVSTVAQGLGRDLSALVPAQRPGEARRLMSRLLDALHVE